MDRGAACRSSVNGSAIAMFGCMTAPRLPRGTRVKPVTAGWKIEETSRDRWNAIAEHSGYSAGALFDLMVETIELDYTGRPTWLPEDPNAGDGSCL